MEDSHTHHCGPEYLEATEPCLFGVFDGHGGDECARFLAHNLCPAISAHASFFEDPQKALEEAFATIDARYCHLAQQLDLEDGSTATVLMLQANEKTGALRYFLACTGDSRAILVRKDGTTKCLVEDHNPNREDERERIRKDGGEVLYDVDNEIFRVASANGGGLAVTRAFGDYHFKPFVTAHPEVAKGDVSDQDAFICLASDGLWNDLSNDEVGQALLSKGPREGVEYVIEEAFARGSDDNITVVVVDLQLARDRLAEEAKRRPPPPASKRSSATRANSRRLSPANKSTSAADEGAGPNQSQSSGSASGTRSSMEGDPLVVTVARKLSVAVPAPLKVSRDVDDVEIPGIPAVFSNDLVLWREPVLSFLWFLIINAMFCLSFFFDFSFMTILAGGLLIRLVTTFSVARIITLFKAVGVLSKDFQTEQFIATNHIVSADTITYFSNAIIGTISPVVTKWTELVIRGSMTNVLITLRTLTYLYTPVPIMVLSWIAFVLIFTIPATYARHKDFIDETAKSMMSKANEVSKKHIDEVKAKAEKLNLWRAAAKPQDGSNKQAPSPNGDIGAGPPFTTSSLASPVDRSTRQSKLGIGHELSEEL